MEVSCRWSHVHSCLLFPLSFCLISVSLPMLKKVRCSFQGAALMFQGCSRLQEKEKLIPPIIALAMSRYFFCMMICPITIMIIHFLSRCAFSSLLVIPLDASFVSEYAGANPHAARKSLVSLYAKSSLISPFAFMRALLLLLHSCVVFFPLLSCL